MLTDQALGIDAISPIRVNPRVNPWLNSVSSNDLDHGYHGMLTDQALGSMPFPPSVLIREIRG